MSAFSGMNGDELHVLLEIAEYVSKEGDENKAAKVRGTM